MGLSVGQLLGGAGQVAKGMREQEDVVMQQRLKELQLQEQNRQDLFRQQAVQPTLDFINQSQQNWTAPGMDGSGLYGDGIRQVPVETPPAQPAPVTGAAQPAPAAPTTPQRGVPLTVPKAGPVSPEAQRTYEQSIAIPPAKVEPFKPGVGPFTGKAFNWMQDGPSLVNPMLNSQGQMNEQAYQATRLQLMKSADDAKQRMQKAGPFAGNEEYFYYQNQLNYVDTIYNGLKRQGKVVAATAAPIEQARAKPEGRAAVENLGGYQLPESQIKRLNDLTNRLPAAVQQQSTIALAQRAVEFGVDPAAAIAISGLENNFGGQATSGAGARGSMQIMPDTYTGVRGFFTNAKNGMPANLQQVAASLPTDISKATPDQLRDAGLLYMYQLQAVNKIPTNLLGAAYHAGPGHESFKQGIAPNVYDKTAKIWTPDHNAMYVSLYNQFTQLAGGQQVLTQPAAPQQGNQLAGMPQPAQGKPATIAGVMQEWTGVNRPAAEPAPRAGVQPTTPKLDQPQVTMPPVGAFDPKQFDALTGQALNTRNHIRQMAILAAQTGNTNKANELAAQLQSIDADLYKMAGDRGVAEFSRYGDPSRMLNVWSSVTGSRLQVQPRSDGKYDLYANGKLLSGKAGLGKDELIGYAKEDTDAKYVASKTALKSWMFQEQFKSGLKMGEKSAEQQGTILINTAKARDDLILETTKIVQTGQRDIAVNAAKEAATVKVANAANGDPVMVFYRGDGSTIGMLNYKSNQFVTAPGGEQIPVAPDIRQVQGFGR